MLICKNCKKKYEPKHLNQKCFCTGKCRKKWSSVFYKERRKELWHDWYNENKEHKKEYSKEFYSRPINKKRKKKASKMWFKKNRKKMRVWYRNYRLNETVRNNDLVRRWTNTHCKKKDMCEICGSVKNLRFHHTRYVRDCRYARTLCKKCHIKQHIS